MTLAGINLGERPWGTKIWCASLMSFPFTRETTGRSGAWPTCVHLFPPLFFFSFRWRLNPFQKKDRKANRWIKRKRDGGKKSHVKERLVQEGWKEERIHFHVYQWLVVEMRFSFFHPAFGFPALPFHMPIFYIEKRSTSHGNVHPWPHPITTTARRGFLSCPAGGCNGGLG